MCERDQYWKTANLNDFESASLRTKFFNIEFIFPKRNRLYSLVEYLDLIPVRY